MKSDDSRFCRTHRLWCGPAHFVKNGRHWTCRTGRRKTQRSYDVTEKGRARFVTYRFGGKGRARDHVYNTSQRGHARCFTYNHGEKGRARAIVNIWRSE